MIRDMATSSQNAHLRLTGRDFCTGTLFTIISNGLRLYVIEPTTGSVTFFNVLFDGRRPGP